MTVSVLGNAFAVGPEVYRYVPYVPYVQYVLCFAYKVTHVSLAEFSIYHSFFDFLSFPYFSIAQFPTTLFLSLYYNLTYYNLNY